MHEASRTRILSWDCAYRTLGWTIVTVDRNVHVRRAQLEQDIAMATTAESRVCAMLAMRDYLSSWFTVEQIGVDDVLDGKKVKNVRGIDRTRALRDYLVRRKALDDSADIVLVEGQPPALTTGTVKKVNTGSSVVGHQLVFYFLDQQVETISPGKKNKVCLAPRLAFEVFSGGNNTYEMRKRHAVASCDELLCYMTRTALAQYLAIPSVVRNNAADALLQVVAYLPSLISGKPSSYRPRAPTSKSSIRITLPDSDCLVELD